MAGQRLPDYRRHFNYCLSACRQTIERAFGIMIRKWGVLRQPLTCDLDKVPMLMDAIVKLNNFCLRRGEDGDWHEEERFRGSCRAVAVDDNNETLADYLNSESGDVVNNVTLEKRERLAQQLWSSRGN